MNVIYEHSLGVKRENVYLSTSRVRIEYDGQLSVKYINNNNNNNMTISTMAP